MATRRTDGPRFRIAGLADAGAVARLHADSWRRHYRGAYSDAFLDGDVYAERLNLWNELLSDGDPKRRTILAERGRLLGFASTLLDEEARCGALLDNLHVAAGHGRKGIGSRLLRLTARAVVEHEEASGLYLWVLEQNVAARAFYEAHGGTCVGRDLVAPPGGVASRLAGAPVKLRYAWPEARVLT